MEILIKKDALDDSKYCISPVGKIDAVTAVEFGTTINDAIDDYDITDLFLDFSQVMYISSMGLRVILELQKKMKQNNANMCISNAQESVLEVFKITGFDKIINMI